MKQPAKPPDDELTAQLRAAVRSRRPFSMTRGLFLVGLLLAPIVAFIWLYQPGSPDVPVVAITFDALTLPGQETELIARVFSGDPEDTEIRLQDRDLIFETQADDKRTSCKTDARGIARVKWTTTEKIAEFVLRWPEGRIADQARIFSLPASSSLLLVDVESTLSRLELPGWKTENILDVPAVAESQKVLRALADKEREVIYLALGSSEPYVHRKVRGWMDNRFAEGWPIGPVLARVNYNAASDQATEYGRVLVELRKKFSGSLSLVVADRELAKTAVDLKLTTFLLGHHEPVPGCVVVKDWPALAEHLNVAEK